MKKLKACPFCRSTKVDASEALGESTNMGTGEKERYIHAGCQLCEALGPKVSIKGETPTSTEVSISIDLWNQRPSAAEVK